MSLPVCRSAHTHNCHHPTLVITAWDLSLIAFKVYSPDLAHQIHDILTVDSAYEECISTIRYLIVVGCPEFVTGHNHMKTEQV